MAKHNKNWSQNKLDGKLKDNRGTGEYEEYKPFLKTQDFSSKGISHRVKGNLINRMYEFFSSTQYNAFLLIEDIALNKKNPIVDIREHFPLWDLHELNIIDETFKNINFSDKISNLDYVFTTTFLLTLTNYSMCYEAISVKYVSDLSKRTVMERLELDRRYWEAKNIKWSVLTNEEIRNNRARLKNIKFYRPAYRLDDFEGVGTTNIDELKAAIIYRISNSEETIIDTLNQIDDQYDLDPGMGLLVFRNILARKEVSINYNREIDLRKKCSDLFKMEV